MNFNRYTLRRMVKLALLLIVVVFFVFHLQDLLHWVSRLFVLLTPFLIGAAMAFVLNVPLRFLERRVFVHLKSKEFKKRQRAFGVLLSLILVTLIIAVVGVIIVPQLIDSITLFAGNIPTYMDNIEKLLLRVAERVPDAKPQIDRMLDAVNSLSPEKVQTVIMDFMKSTPFGETGKGSFVSTALSSTFGLVSSVFDFLLNGVLGFVFAIYILFAKETLAVQGRRIVFAFWENDMAKYIVHVFQVGFAKFYSFLTGQLTEAFILGTLMFLGMFILRLPYALMIGVLIGFTALIPIAGAIIGGFIGFLLVLSVSTTKALIFFLFMVFLQQFESNVIYPRVVGGSVGLPAMWTLFAITIGGSLMGLVGMLIFVPLTSTVYTLFAEIIYGRLQMKNISQTDPIVLYGVPDDKRLS